MLFKRQTEVIDNAAESVKLIAVVAGLALVVATIALVIAVRN